MISATVGIDALHDMRRERRRHRVADMEWFEALYRVYLAALIGGGAILYLSDMVTDTPLTAAQLRDLHAHTPHVVGLLTAVVVFMGLRSGANGGPLAVEDAEVRHVLMAPVDHGQVLRHPAVQRLRTFMFSGAIAGGVANQLLGRRVPGATAGLVAFTLWGAVAGALIGALFVVSALLAHGLAVSRWLVNLLAGLLVSWQAVVTFGDTHVAGPFDFVGSVSMWWSRWSMIDTIGVVVVCALALLGVRVTARFSLEALARRSALVSQLRFAVTLQDIRTVILLRRQLSQEYMRVKPWAGLPRALRRDVVVARGLRSILHFPVRRLSRMALFSVGAALALVTTWHGTTPMVVVSGLLLFVVGLDAVEPLSQEVDQPDRTDSLPWERALLMTKHLVVPAVVVLPFVVLGVGAAFVREPSLGTVGYGFLIGIPAAWGGVAGAVINAVKGAPDPVGGATQGLALPPEVSGMGTVLRAVWPPTVAVAACLPVIAVRETALNGTQPLGVAVRAAGAVLVMLALVAGWVRQRDNIHAWFRNAQKQSSLASSQRTEGP